MKQAATMARLQVRSMHVLPWFSVCARSFEFALSLRLIHSERVDLGLLVQETFLRRDRNREVWTRNNNRLSELAIPGTKGHLLPLERREIEILAADRRVDRSKICRMGARCGFANGADRDPGLVVNRPHETIGKPLEAVLHLCRAPRLVCWMPAHRLEASGAGDGTRVPRAKGKIGAEHLPFVGDYYHVVSWGSLREDWHLLLDLLFSGVRASSAGSLFILAFLDDRATEPLRRPANRVEICEVFRKDTLHHEPALPLLPHEILGERVGEHVAIRRGVQYVGAAFLLPQLFILGAHVEQKHILSLDGVGKLEKRVRRRIDEDEVVTARHELLQRRHSVTAYRHPLDIEREILLSEPPRGVVVRERQFRAGNAVVLGLRIEP